MQLHQDIYPPLCPKAGFPWLLPLPPRTFVARPASNKNHGCGRPHVTVFSHAWPGISDQSWSVGQLMLAGIGWQCRVSCSLSLSMGAVPWWMQDMGTIWVSVSLRCQWSRNAIVCPPVHVDVSRNTWLLIHCVHEWIVIWQCSTYVADSTGSLDSHGYVFYVDLLDGFALDYLPLSSHWIFLPQFFATLSLLMEQKWWKCMCIPEMSWEVGWFDSTQRVLVSSCVSVSLLGQPQLYRCIVICLAPAVVSFILFYVLCHLSYFDVV